MFSLHDILAICLPDHRCNNNENPTNPSNSVHLHDWHKLSRIRKERIHHQGLWPLYLSKKIVILHCRSFFRLKKTVVDKMISIFFFLVIPYSICYSQFGLFTLWLYLHRLQFLIFTSLSIKWINIIKLILFSMRCMHIYKNRWLR